MKETLKILIIVFIPILGFSQVDESNSKVKFYGGINYPTNFKRPKTNSYTASQNIKTRNKIGGFVYIESPKLIDNLTIRSGVLIRRFSYEFKYDTWIYYMIIKNLNHKLNISEISIPVEIGYYILDKPKFNLYVYTGISYRKVLKKYGELSSTNNMKINEKEIEFRIDGQNFDNNLNFGFGFNYIIIDSKLSIYGQINCLAIINSGHYYFYGGSVNNNADVFDYWGADCMIDYNYQGIINIGFGF